MRIFYISNFSSSSYSLRTLSNNGCLLHVGSHPCCVYDIDFLTGIRDLQFNASLVRLRSELVRYSWAWIYSESNKKIFTPAYSGMFCLFRKYTTNVLNNKIPLVVVAVTFAVSRFAISRSRLRSRGWRGVITNA